MDVLFLSHLTPSNILFHRCYLQVIIWIFYWYVTTDAKTCVTEQISRKQQPSLLHRVHPQRPTEQAGSFIWSLLLHPVFDLCSLFPGLCLMFLHTSPKFPTLLSSALRCSIGPQGLLLAHSSCWRWQGATAKQEMRPEIGIIGFCLLLMVFLETAIL